MNLWRSLRDRISWFDGSSGLVTRLPAFLISKITEGGSVLINMLKAIERMLPNYKDDGLPEEKAARVDCARTILLEVISSLETNPPTDIIQVPITAVIEHPKQVSKEKTPLGDKPTLETKPTREPQPVVETRGDEWMITLDEGGGLKILDFPLDGLIELDGKKMTYGEARGQKFKKARIL